MYSEDDEEPYMLNQEDDGNHSDDTNLEEKIDNSKSQDSDEEDDSEDKIVAEASIPAISTLASTLKCLNMTKHGNNHLIISFHEKYIMLTHSNVTTPLNFVAYLEAENLLKYEYKHKEPTFQASYDAEAIWKSVERGKSGDPHITLVINISGTLTIYSHVGESRSHIQSLSAATFDLKYPLYTNTMKNTKFILLASSIQEKLFKLPSMETLQNMYFMYCYHNGFSVDAYGEDGSSINTTCIGDADDGYDTKESITQGSFSCIPTESESRAGVIRKFSISKDILKSFNSILKLCPKTACVRILVEEWKPLFMQIKLGTLGRAFVFIEHSEH